METNYIHNTWFIGLSILICLINLTVAYGTKSDAIQFFKEFRKLPMDIQHEVFLSYNTLIFLGNRPITLAGPDGQNGSVYSLAMNDDNIVTGTFDKIAKIWNIHTGQLKCTLTAPINAMAPVSINNTKVATATPSPTHTIKIWNIDPNKLLHTLKGHTNIITSVAINENRVITGSVDKTVKIWNIHTSALLHTLTGYTKSIYCIVISGDKVATESEDNIVVWQIDTAQLLHTLTDHNGGVKSLAIHSDRLVTGSENGTAKIWDLCTGKSLHTLKGHTSRILLVLISNNKVITNEVDNVIKIWNIHNGTLLHTIHVNKLSALAVYSDICVTGSYDNTATIWNLNNGQSLKILEGHTKCILSVAINSDNVFTGSADATTKIWPITLNLKGTFEDNPLLWIIKKSDILQLNFINRACQATIAKQDLIIDLPKKFGKIKENDSQEQADGNVYFSFPQAIREYLRTRLNIRK